MDKSSKDKYKKYADSHAPKSPLFKDCLWAFFVGGFVCLLGEILTEIYMKQNMAKDDAATLTSVSLIFLAILLTGLGVFDKIAQRAGAGVLVPITGFANAVAAPAIDTKTEGFVLGVGAKMFSIAGPVIVYGTVAGVIYGVIYWVVVSV